jgi:4-hydroxythreonine-4-phosphate dehydrogenase
VDESVDFIMKRLALTMGDPAGIGYEVIEAAFREKPALVEEVVVIGYSKWITRLEDQFGMECMPIPTVSDIILGKPSIEGAANALEAMRVAAKGCEKRVFSGVVTGPISKDWCQQAGMKHPGQTEYFASHWSGEPTMAFVSKQMIVSLVTWHIPLMSVWNALTSETVSRALSNTIVLLERMGHSHPRIGVCGLNPHAGEMGRIGKEEVEFLNPLIDTLKSDAIELSGCHPADTLFYRHISGEFDAVIALYHDQALAPLKTIAFHDAVNVTLGLSHVRTSPDHGTAYGIAGKGLARPDSLISAIELALKLR